MNKELTEEQILEILSTPENKHERSIKKMADAQGLDEMSILIQERLEYKPAALLDTLDTFSEPAYNNPCSSCSNYGKGPCFCTVPNMNSPIY